MFIFREIYEPCFIHDSYSNRKNRGIHAASKRAEHFMRGSRYYLQLDVKSFFYSINKEILFAKLKKKIIVYMNDFDNFVKRKLKVKRYLRYVDDFILFADRQEELLESHEQIVEYLHDKLELTLHERYILRENAGGLDFSGYTIRPHYTLVRKRVVNNFKYKKAQYLKKYETMRGTMGLEEIKQFLSVRASFAGHCKHVPDRRDKCPWGVNSYNLTQKIGVIDENNPFDYDRA